MLVAEDWVTTDSNCGGNEREDEDDEQGKGKRGAYSSAGSSSSSAPHATHRRHSTGIRTARRRSSLTTLSVLLVRPVDPNRPTSKPLAVHRGDGLLGVGLVPECEETVTPALARVHVPHDPRVRERAERHEGLVEDGVVDFGREVTDEEVAVVREVLLLSIRVLVSPVDADLHVEDLATIERRKGRLGGAHLVVLDKAAGRRKKGQSWENRKEEKRDRPVVDTAMLEGTVGNDLDAENGTCGRGKKVSLTRQEKENKKKVERTCDGKDLLQHVLCHARREVSDIEMRALGSLSTRAEERAASQVEVEVSSREVRREKEGEVELTERRRRARLRWGRRPCCECVLVQVGGVEGRLNGVRRERRGEGERGKKGEGKGRRGMVCKRRGKCSEGEHGDNRGEEPRSGRSG